MRYVNLKKLQCTICYNRVIGLGCGPNFVLNRFDQFKVMIKDQGVKFWFRFWLNFCFHPDIIAEAMCFNSHIIEVMRILCGSIHKHFLEGSPKGTVNFCLELFTCMAKNDEEKPSGNDVSEEQLVQEENVINQLEVFSNRDPLNAYMKFLFGCALCEVFYIWLEANPIRPGMSYWTMPDIYSKKDFQPRLIEHYIVYIWGVRIFQLLGVFKEKIYWVQILLAERQKIVTFDLENTHWYRSTAQINKKEFEYWDKKLGVMKSKLLNYDETKIEFTESKNGARNCAENKETGLVSTTVSTDDQPKVVPRCAFCFSTESYTIKLKKCSLCANDLKTRPKYYCGLSCQTEDWVRSHAKEHFAFLNKIIKYNQDVIEESTAVESKLFTASLFDNWTKSS